MLMAVTPSAERTAHARRRLLAATTAAVTALLGGGAATAARTTPIVGAETRRELALTTSDLRRPWPQHVEEVTFESGDGMQRHAYKGVPGAGGRARRGTPPTGRPCGWPDLR